MSKVAIVTGGSRGIGAAISVALKAAGYTVAANYAGNDEAAAGIVIAKIPFRVERPRQIAEIKGDAVRFAGKRCLFDDARP